MFEFWLEFRLNWSIMAHCWYVVPVLECFFPGAQSFLKRLTSSLCSFLISTFFPWHQLPQWSYLRHCISSQTYSKAPQREMVEIMTHVFAETRMYLEFAKNLSVHVITTCFFVLFLFANFCFCLLNNQNKVPIVNSYDSTLF